MPGQWSLESISTLSLKNYIGLGEELKRLRIVPVLMILE